MSKGRAVFYGTVRIENPVCCQRILYEKLLIISQRFFGIPPFRFYALADGIRRILSQGAFSPPEMPPASLQLELALGWEG